MPLFSLTISWQWFLKGLQIVVTIFSKNLPLLIVHYWRKKYISKYHNWEANGESNQWHKWPANLKSILVFVKHSPCPFVLYSHKNWPQCESIGRTRVIGFNLPRIEKNTLEVKNIWSKKQYNECGGASRGHCLSKARLQWPQIIIQRKEKIKSA